MDIQLPNQPKPSKTVCGGFMANPEQYPSAIYNGERVYFCTRGCLRVFEGDPDRFIRGEIEHPKESEYQLILLTESEVLYETEKGKFTRVERKLSEQGFDRAV